MIVDYTYNFNEKTDSYNYENIDIHLEVTYPSIDVDILNEEKRRLTNKINKNLQTIEDIDNEIEKFLIEDTDEYSKYAELRIEEYEKEIEEIRQSKIKELEELNYDKQIKELEKKLDNLQSINLNSLTYQTVRKGNYLKGEDLKTFLEDFEEFKEENATLLKLSIEYQKNNLEKYLINEEEVISEGAKPIYRIDGYNYTITDIEDRVSFIKKEISTIIKDYFNDLIEETTNDLEFFQEEEKLARRKVEEIDKVERIVSIRSTIKKLERQLDTSKRQQKQSIHYHNECMELELNKKKKVLLKEIELLEEELLEIKSKHKKRQQYVEDYIGFDTFLKQGQSFYALDGRIISRSDHFRLIIKVDMAYTNTSTKTKQNFTYDFYSYEDFFAHKEVKKHFGTSFSNTSGFLFQAGLQNLFSQNQKVYAKRMKVKEAKLKKKDALHKKNQTNVFVQELGKKYRIKPSKRRTKLRDMKDKIEELNSKSVKKSSDIQDGLKRTVQRTEDRQKRIEEEMKEKIKRIEEVLQDRLMEVDKKTKQRINNELVIQKLKIKSKGRPNKSKRNKKKKRK